MLKRVTKIGSVLLLLVLVGTLLPSKSSAQNLITVPFTNGFVGRNTANNASDSCYYLFGLGWKNIQFAQNSTANIFVAQGNDIIGMVLITDNNNVQHTINGFIKWRAPSGQVTTICFQPAPGTNLSLATNGSNGKSTYALDSNKYIGLTFNGQTLSISPIPGVVTGNAATSGLLTLLNDYLNSFPRIIVFGTSTNASDSIVYENAGTKNINIKLTAPSTNTIKVRYKTIAGTALPGQDYTTVQDTLTFVPNDTVETISVPIINNLVVEPNEYFDINLFEPTNAVLLNPTKRITIIDDDVANTPPNANDDAIITKEDSVTIINVLANDIDTTGLLNPPTIKTQPQHGTVTVNANGTITFTPTANYFGLDSFMYKVCDNGTPSLCDSAWVRLTINSVNDAPDAVDDNASLNEDTPATINVRSNDTDIDGTLNNPTIKLNPTHGTVTVNTNGTITYTPNANYFGLDSFMYKVCDNGTPILCDSAWVRLTINSVNDAPIVRGDTLNSNGSGPFIINILDNDSDDGGFGTPTICHTPKNGTATVNANGTVTYTPNTNFSGLDSFMYCICDNGTPIICDSAWVRITLSATNTPPNANDDNYTINEDAVTDLNVRSNDTDQGGALNNPTALINPKHGSITINPNGTIKYTPSTNYNGVDSFMYKVCDNGTPSMCDSAWVRLTINSVNDAPDATDDTLSVDEDGSKTIDVRNNDTDVDGTINPPSLPIPPSKGTVTINPNGSITYVPNPNVFGPDSFMYKICDNGMPVLCDSAWVRININPINDRPKVNPDTLNVNEDDSITVDVRLNDTDDGVLNPPTLPILPSKGTVTINPDGSITYKPNPDVFGKDSFMYKLCDNGTPVLCDSAWVRININPINDKPNANDDNATTIGGQPVVINVRQNDTDKEGALNPPVILLNPANGTVVVNPNGTITYTPNPNYLGPDSFMYKVCDNGMPVLCDSAWVRINNNPGNGGPVANDDDVNATEDQPLVIDVKLNDIINDGSNNPPTIVTNPANGTVTITPDGKINYVPNPDYNGLDSFMYKICNNANPVKCDSAWVRVNVGAVNDAPNANDDIATVTKNGNVDINVRGNDTDKEGKTTINNPVVITNPKNGTATVNSDGTIKYTPALNYLGTDSFMYKVCDNGTPILCDSAWVRINVVNPLTNPIAINDTLLVNENGQGKINVVKNDINPNGNGFSLPQIITNPSHGVLLPIAVTDTTFMYVPNTGYIGADKFTYVVADASNSSLRDTAEVLITVNQLEVKVPGGFSPDKDGLNDAFVIPGIEKYPNNKLTIVNRWGEVVYFKEKYNNEWTGEPNKGFVMDDGIVPAGTYFYILETGTGSKPISGSIYINR